MRYRPQIEWSKKSLVHNIFRLFELIFGRKQGVRIENITKVFADGERLLVRREFYTLESLLVFIEQLPFIAFQNLERWREVFQMQIHLHPYILQKGAIALDLATTSTSGVQNITFSHTTSGSNRGLVVDAEEGTGAVGSTTVSSETYNSIALTSRITTDTNGHGELWSLIAPATGANTVAINWAANPTNNRQANVAISFTGVDQTTMHGASGSSSNSSSSTQSIVITTNIANSWLLGTCWIATGEAETLTTTAGTQRWNFNGSDSFTISGGATVTTTTPASTTASWSTSTTRSWHTLGLEIVEVQGGAVARKPMMNLPLLGVS